MAYCNEYVELISAAIDGALSPAEQARLESHLAQCPDCKALCEDLKAVHRALLELPPVEVPAGLTDRIMEAVAKDNITALPKPKRPVLQWRRWAVAAAAAVVLVGIGTLQPQQSPKSAKGRMIAPASIPDPHLDADEDAAVVEGEVIENEAADFFGQVAPETYVMAAPPEPNQAPGQTFSQKDRTETAGIIPSLGSVQNTASDNIKAADSNQTADVEEPAEEAIEALPLSREAALDLVVERCFGNSGYEMVREDPEGEPLSCHVSLMDQDTFVVGGAIVCTGETEEFFLFECHWDEDPENPYHYSVHKTEGYVAWQGEVLGNEP